MVVYYVRWEKKDGNEPKRGRPKMSSTYYDFTVLCNSVSDAVNAFEFLFRTDFNKDQSYSQGDGVLSFSRVTLDSRCFHIRWLMMKGLKEPISLIDPGATIFKLSRQI